MSNVRYLESTTLPTPSSSYDDVYFNLRGGSGNRDRVYFCMKGEDDNYDWVEIVSGGAE